METALAVALAVPLILIVAIPAVLINGYVMWVLWGWFVVPLGVQQVSIAWAIGLAILINAMVGVIVPEEREEKWYMPLLKVYLLRPGGALLGGYVAKLYM